MTDRVPAIGSCVRCQRALGLMAEKVDGEWYGTAACALGDECPLESRTPEVAETALFSRPRRFFHRRRPKELKLGS
jgi:hypothetical protein